LFTYACECGGGVWFCGVYDDLPADPETGTGLGPGLVPEMRDDHDDDVLFCDA
jgi:hypothetical protein